MNAEYNNSSRYLVYERPLMVLPTLVMALDKNANMAMMLQQINFWLGVAEQSEGRNGRFKDGRWWIYNSVAAWNRQLPFLSKRTVERHLARLIELGVLIKEEEIDPGAKGGCRTWFSIDYDQVDKLVRDYRQNVGSPAEGGYRQNVGSGYRQNDDTFTYNQISDSQDPDKNDPDLPQAAKSGSPAALDAGSQFSGISRRNRGEEKRVKVEGEEKRRIGIDDLSELGRFLLQQCGRGTHYSVSPFLTGAQADALAAEYEVPHKGQLHLLTPDDLFESDPYYRQWIETEVYALLRAQGGDKPIARGKMVDAVTMGSTIMNLAKFLEWKEKTVEKEEMAYALAHAETVPEMSVSLLAGIDDMDFEDEDFEDEDEE